MVMNKKGIVLLLFALMISFVSLAQSSDVDTQAVVEVASTDAVECVDADACASAETCEVKVEESVAVKASNADKIEHFKEYDPYGFVMALLAMSVVFCALLVLCLSFICVGKISEMIAKRNKLKAHGIEAPVREELKSQKGDSGEEIAAIAMALYEHINAHDDESTILTINKVERTYSPWSSKIYSLRQTPKN